MHPFLPIANTDMLLEPPLFATNKNCPEFKYSIETADGPLPVLYVAVDCGVNAPVLALTTYAERLSEPSFAT
jgi:hypothetical protein